MSEGPLKHIQGYPLFHCRDAKCIPESMAPSLPNPIPLVRFQFKKRIRYNAQQRSFHELIDAVSFLRLPKRMAGTGLSFSSTTGRSAAG